MLSIGNKKYRNLQEQVGYNTEEIEKIKDLIDGIVIDDKLVVIDSASGSLSEAQMEVLDGPLAFISYNEKVYLKTSESATELVFKAIDIKAEEIGSAYFNIGGSKVVITIATKVYTVSDDLIITSYSKSQIDSIIANILTLLNGKASLNGANFTGAITGPSIIENMNGYSYSAPEATAGWTREDVYVGACKNGNKLTLIMAFNLTKTDAGAPTSIGLGTIGIPADVLAKLYPVNIGGINFLARLNVQAVDTYYGDGVMVKSWLSKNANDIGFGGGVENLVLNTKYYIRLECTFLLSDSLV